MFAISIRIRPRSTDVPPLAAPETKRFPLLAIALCAFLGATMTTAIASGPIAPGDDIFSTPCGGGAYDNEPIPAGFFASIGGSSSKVYFDGIDLGGVPIANGAIPPADVDTIVRRLTGTSPTFTCGSTETIPIEIQALHLTSCSPITVEYENNTTEDWNVDVCLTSTQTIGSMTINHECQAGGSYVATLPVEAALEFTRVGGGPGSPLTLVTSLTFESYAWWRHNDGGFGLSRLSPGSQFDDDCAFLDPGDPSTINGPTADFYPGLFMQGCSSCTPVAAGGICCQPHPTPGCGNPACEQCVCSIFPHCCGAQWDPGCVNLAQEKCGAACGCGGQGPPTFKPAINPEQAALAAHGLAPANPGKHSGGGGPPIPTEACCKPEDPLPGNCIDVTPADCVNLYGGFPQGPGTNCATLVCNPPAYENWVLADDFCVDCPECSCDFDNNGVCTATDLGFAANCVNNASTAGCDQVDLNCDGRLTNADLAIAQCLFQGGVDCCPHVRPGINRIRWYGSYFDPNFEPPIGGGPPLRPIDSWLIGLHSDVPPVACPAPPAGTTPIDLCGSYVPCTNNPGVCVFQPDGSAFLYQTNPIVNAPCPTGKVRLCGFLDPNAPTVCPNTIGQINVNATLSCPSGISRPDRLIAQWAIDPALVPIDQTGKVGWDQHRIFCYTADLPNACLLHNYFDADEYDAVTRIFTPKPNRTYWLSIQASVGHALVMNANGTCTEIDLNRPPITQDFWGWHTTPPGYQHKDDAYMGTLYMAMDPDDPLGCDRSWVYNWMSHLHCSDPKYHDCCDDPTKSIDLAFYLIHANGQCSSSGAPCNTNANCPAGQTCVRTEWVRWCQPVNPGPPPNPGGPINPLPRGGIDEFLETSAEIVINLPGVPAGEQIVLTGPTVVTRVQPQPEPPGPSTFQTEMTLLDLHGASQGAGGVVLRLNPANQSMGAATRNQNSHQINSFFDVFIVIELTDMARTVRTNQPVRLQATHFEVPPGRTHFQGPVGGPVDLFDNQTGQLVGSIKSVDHFIPYNGGINIHSDIDWPNSPMVDCCEPNNAQNGCEPVVCPDPNEICQPTKVQCGRVCIGGTNPGATCTSNADCPGGGTCSATSACRVIDCECRGPNECHAVINPPPVQPQVDCVGGCPVPGLICTRMAMDTNGDGVDDNFMCRCDPVVGDPLGVCCDTTGNCAVTLQSACPVPPNLSFHPGATCVGPEACCLPNDTCAMIEPVCCQDLGGTVIVNGVCTAPAACCNPLTGTCTNVDPLCCNGTSHPGALCTAVEACCFTNGSCANLDPVCCVDAGGMPAGAGTFCMGDANGNGVDDACENCPPTNRPGLGDDRCFTPAGVAGIGCGFTGDCPAGQTCGNKNEYLSFVPDNAGQITALRVTNVSIPQFPALNGQQWWVGQPTAFTECNGTVRTIARLQCTPFCTDWGNISLLDVYGGAVLPNSLYDVQAVDCACNLSDPASYSAARRIGTSECGDVIAPFGGAAQPNFADINAVVSCFQCLAGAPRLARCDIHPCLPPNQNANFQDINRAVMGFQGGICPCNPGTCP